MDIFDWLFLIFTRGPIVLIALYLLTILLRVACHLNGVGIPAFGRAFFVTSLIVVSSATVGWYLQFNIVGSDGPPELGPQFVALLVALGFHFTLAAVVYRLALRTNTPRALSVWLFQAVLFLALGLVGGCCIAGLSSVFGVGMA